MKITWVQDLDPMCQGGGGQLNDRGKIKKGLHLGHDIKIITPQNGHIENPDCDLLIISNHVMFNKKFIDEITSKYPYVFYHKDYNFYPHRLYFYKGEECKKFPNREWWLKLYLGAKAHIWLSPLHRDHFLYAFPELAKFPNLCVPSSIDTGLFKPIDGIVRKPNTVIGINSLLEFKGRYKIYEYVKAHPEFQFTFVGEGNEVNAGNVDYVPYTKNEDLPKLFSVHEYAIALPQTSDPFGRALVESLLCGCKIITNKLYGAFSYEFMKQDPNENSDQYRERIRYKMSEASIGFWETISEIMGWDVE